MSATNLPEIGFVEKTDTEQSSCIYTKFSKFMEKMKWGSKLVYLRDINPFIFEKVFINMLILNYDF